MPTCYANAEIEMVFRCGGWQGYQASPRILPPVVLPPSSPMLPFLSMSDKPRRWVRPATGLTSILLAVAVLRTWAFSIRLAYIPPAAPTKEKPGTLLELEAAAEEREGKGSLSLLVALCEQAATSDGRKRGTTACVRL